MAWVGRDLKDDEAPSPLPHAGPTTSSFNARMGIMLMGPFQLEFYDSVLSGEISTSKLHTVDCASKAEQKSAQSKADLLWISGTQ